MSEFDSKPAGVKASTLLVTGAIVFIAVTIIWGVILLLNLLPGQLPFGGAARLRTVMPNLLTQAVLFGVLAVIIRIIPALRKLGSRPFVINILLAILVIYLPVSILEISLNPFVGDDRPTSIFMHDPDRIWKLRPNAEDYWGGCLVRINGKGLRGRELEYEKTKNVYRILYLGDSVTFGYRLAKAEDSFPFRVEPILEKNLGCEVETINAGIGGYSPWQEHLFLTEEGIRYDPDIVVLALVLNDFTQKFSLQRYDGFWKGYQLAMNGSFLMGRLSNHSNIIGFIRKKALDRRYGFDPVSKAEDIEYNITYDLIHQPDAEHVKLAVETTLENLKGLVESCEEMKLPLLVVAFPLKFQLLDPDGTRYPQDVLAGFFKENSVPFLDLLIPMTEKMHSSGLLPEHLFIDDNHLTIFGNEIAAGEIAEAIAKQGLLRNPPADSPSQELGL